jgi:hypothetical protein
MFFFHCVMSWRLVSSGWVAYSISSGEPSGYSRQPSPLRSV